MGRNMFGPVRGDWGDGSWAAGGATIRPTTTTCSCSRTTPRSDRMQGGTTFHFVTDGIESALEQARGAAGDRDVAVAGGCSTVQQFLRQG